MHEVNSSTISHIGHDPLKNELTVRFHNGHTYTYAGVTPDQHRSLLNASSVGKHFSEHIRPKFKGIRLTRT